MKTPMPEYHEFMSKVRSKDFVYEGPVTEPVQFVEVPPMMPRYLPPPKVVSRTREAVGVMQVDGWCMWPNLWHEDLVLFRRINPLYREKGRHYPATPPGDDWKCLCGEIALVLLDGKPMVKRIINTTNWFQMMLDCDNRIWHYPILFANYEETNPHDLCVFGVVESVIPGRRQRNRLPEYMREEFDRIHTASGRRRTREQMDREMNRRRKEMFRKAVTA